MLVSIVLLCLCPLTSSKRVMFMPMPITSHNIVHVNLARAVAGLGHEVTLVLASYVVSKGGLNTEGMRVIEYPTINFDDDVVYATLLEPQYAGREPDLNFLVERLVQMNSAILENETLYREMKTVEPDLVVIDDDASGARMFAVFAYRMRVPFAAVDYTFEPYARRVPFSPAVTPSYMHPFTHHMTFMERLENTVFFLVKLIYDPFCYDDAVARYAPEMPYVSLNTLLGRAEIWLVQSDHILDYPKPTLPNVRMIGSIASSPPKPLSPDLQSFMDKATDGVVVVSFGSLVHTFPRELGEDVLMQAFKSLTKLKVVFRSNLTSPDPERIVTSPWIPQNDLLAHPNTKVLVTHCGMSSQYQALYHAVPMVGIPLFYDQGYNERRMTERGFGRSVRLMALTPSQLVEAIQDVATNPRYKYAITRASTLYRELYKVPVERAAYWLDHVINYGGGHLRSSGQEIPLYQFLLLDVLAVMGGGVVLFFLVSCGLLRCLYRCVCRRKTKTD